MLLNEVLPAPKDAYGAEWVELYNPGDTAVDLSGWSIDDSADGGGHSIADGTVIAPGAQLTIELGRAILNNSGDTVRLLDAAGTLIDSFAYVKAKSDRSFSRGAVGWDEAEPSPGAPNAAPEPGEAAEATSAAGVEATGEEPDPPAEAPGAPLAAGDAEPTLAGAQPTDSADGPPLWQIAPDLRVGAVTPAPTYAVALPNQHDSAGAACAGGQGCAGPTIAAASPAAPDISPAPAPPESVPAGGGPAPIWPLAAGGALIVTAAALLVVEQTPGAPESEEDGVL